MAGMEKLGGLEGTGGDSYRPFGLRPGPGKRVPVSLGTHVIVVLLLLVCPSALIAQDGLLPSKADQKKITDWLEACNLNREVGSVTCEEIEHCVGRRTKIKKKDHPLIYELMRDPDGDGIVCEPWRSRPSAKKPKGDVVFGLGFATGVQDRDLGPLSALDAEGNPVLADVRGGETRPVATAAYLFAPPNDGARVRWGIMAVLDTDIVADDALVKPRGIGIGGTLAFRGTLGDNWAQAFGIGVVYLWESAKLLSDAPNPVLEDRTAGSVLLVVNYSFGKRWWQ